MADDLPQNRLNALMRPRMVCVCKRVPETRIREVIEAGADTFEDIQRLTDCSTGCGTCENSVRDVLAKYRPAPALDRPEDAGSDSPADLPADSPADLPADSPADSPV